MNAFFKEIDLQFKFEAGTSRGILTSKPSIFIILNDGNKTGIGECSIIPGLSIDPIDQFKNKVSELCNDINNGKFSTDLSGFPSISFGLETALLDLLSDEPRILFPSAFTKENAGIPINGLVWMGNKEFMEKQITEKINAGYKCIKLKVGALDFNTELEIIKNIRKNFSENDIEIRLDANGGFAPENALEKLKTLSDYDIHSIEQPIKQGQVESMAKICNSTPIPIVLDEELIGVQQDQFDFLLETIKPHYIILKPGLLGGFKTCENWIRNAENLNINWWITSALESNIGLNAIAQWTYTLQSALPQGLGTGQLYHNNIPSPLEIKDANLIYNNEIDWNLSSILG